MWIRPFNHIVKKYPYAKHIRLTSDLNKGDYTFYTDFLEILPLEKSDIPDYEYYIGPIFLDELFTREDES